MDLLLWQVVPESEVGLPHTLSLHAPGEKIHPRSHNTCASSAGLSGQEDREGVGVDIVTPGRLIEQHGDKKAGEGTTTGVIPLSAITYMTIS